MKNLLLVLTASVSLLVPSLTTKAQSVTSPDGKWIVFVKPVTGNSIGTGVDDFQPSELWQVDSNGRHPTLLVRCHDSVDNEYEDCYRAISGLEILSKWTAGLL
jgi:hypothetical protein